MNWIKEHKLLVAIVLVAAVAVGTVGGVEIADRPRFCGVLCHEMQYYVDSLERSPHGKNEKGVEVICMDCHSEQGFVNHTIEHVKASFLITEHFNEHYKEDHFGIHAAAKADYEKHSCTGCHPGRSEEAFFMRVPEYKDEMVNENCLRCHGSVLEEKQSSEKRLTSVAIPHALHRENGILCTECHGLVVHGSNPNGFNKPSMHTCFEKCHDDKNAPRSKCEVCHVLPNNMLIGTGGRGVPDTEGVMSGSVSCPECHSMQEPAITHGVITFRFEPQSCIDCHDDDYGKMVRDWQKDRQKKLANLDRRFGEIFEKVQKKAFNADLDNYIKSANENLTLIRMDPSKGVHNPQYIDTLSASVNKNLDMAAKRLSL